MTRLIHSSPRAYTRFRILKRGGLDDKRAKLCADNWQSSAVMALLRKHGRGFFKPKEVSNNEEQRL